eukprot:2379854-Pyramimonas_sp.AAC.1
MSGITLLSRCRSEGFPQNHRLGLASRRHKDEFHLGSLPRRRFKALAVWGGSVDGRRVAREPCWTTQEEHETCTGLSP